MIHSGPLVRILIGLIGKNPLSLIPHLSTEIDRRRITLIIRWVHR